MNKNRSSHSRQPKRGFSFIEVLVVIIILGLLSGIVGVYLFDSAEQAKADATKTQIKGLETALDLYRLHNSRYPSNEQGLKAFLKPYKSFKTKKMVVADINDVDLSLIHI